MDIDLDLVRVNLERRANELSARRGTDDPPSPEEEAALASAQTMFESFKAARIDMAKAAELNEAARDALEAGDATTAGVLLNEASVRLLGAEIEHGTIEAAD